MKRLTTWLAAVAAISITGSNVAAQNIRAIEARVISIEDRLTVLEKEVFGEVVKPGAAQIPDKVTAAKPSTEPYIIRGGDSIGGIARNFGIPRQALLDANGMKEGEPIYIGEALLIPSKPKGNTPALVGNGAIHTVQPGDTLMGLSRKYKVTVKDIKSANKLNSDVIGVGQKLAIPRAETMAEKKKAVPSQTHQTAMTVGKYQYDNPLLNSNETYGYYTVQKGDNLYALARDFFTTMQELQRLNKLGSSTVIHSGDELVVPTSKYNAYHQNVAQN